MGKLTNNESVQKFYTILKIIGMIFIIILSIATTYIQIDDHEKRITKLEETNIIMEEKVNSNRDLLKETWFNTKSIAKKIGADYISTTGDVK